MGGGRLTAASGAGPEAAEGKARRFGRLHDMTLGQVGEWLIWTQLAGASGGDLHVFLPLTDRGIDGIVHRISTDEYARLQVKALSWRNERRNSVVVTVYPDELVDERAFVVATHVDIGDPALREQVLVVPAPVYVANAHLSGHPPAIQHQATLRLPPVPGSVWAQYCHAPAAIGDALLPPPALEAAQAAVVAPAWAPSPPGEPAKRLGYRAEMELVRRAADCDSLNTFKAFPDLEPNEYVLYNLQTFAVTGIQVKAVSLPPGETAAKVNVHRASLRPSATTWFVVFLADDWSLEFLPDCAVIPSTVVAHHLAGEGRSGALNVNRGVTGRFARWRVPVAELGGRLGELG
ncbi:MAG: hypothetical protein ACYDAC_12655 [Candidatus Dormibacteria bacterium]